MGRSRGGLTTKIHASVDAEGRPIRLRLTPGQAGDAPVGKEFVADLDPGATLLADRAYDTNPIREGAAPRGVWADIPPRAIRKDAYSFSPWLYRQRNLIERFFNRIKPFRDLATRCDRRPDNYPAAIRFWIAAKWRMARRSPGRRSQRVASPGRPATPLKRRSANLLFWQALGPQAGTP